VDALARVGLALSDDSRRRLIATLVDGPGYPSELADALGLTRANVSNHLSCLRGCGLVVAQPEGRRVRYELADRKLARALRDLLDLVLVVDPAVCPASDDDECC
jgi:DNA-binding transcriptional ArsR family regulator